MLVSLLPVTLRSGIGGSLTLRIIATVDPNCGILSFLRKEKLKKASAITSMYSRDVISFYCTVGEQNVPQTHVSAHYTFYSAARARERHI